MTPRFAGDYECLAHVPDPLPASLALESETYATVIDAASAMARADQAAALLPNPGLLARPATRREAVSISALEGTYAALIGDDRQQYQEDGHQQNVAACLGPTARGGRGVVGSCSQSRG